MHQRTSPQDKSKPLPNQLLKAFLIGLILFALYVLSYAPYLRLTDNEQSRFYKPVEWLLVETPLKSTIVKWGAICGVDVKMIIFVEKANLMKKVSKLPPDDEWQGPFMHCQSRL